MPLFISYLYTHTDSDASVEGITYALNISERLGRSTSKEQYAFLYRTDRVEVVSTHQYDDSANDDFEREPYSVLIRSRDQGEMHVYTHTHTHTHTYTHTHTHTHTCQASLISSSLPFTLNQAPALPISK